MKAVVYNKNGMLEIIERDKRRPRKDEVSIRVSYCGICGTDVHIRHGSMDKRVGDQRVIGHEMSGEVFETGENVTSVKKGDRVVLRPLLSCGTCAACKNGLTHICYNLKFIGIETDGAFQELMIAPVQLLHKIPDRLPMDTAALIEPAAVACHDVRRGKVKNGDYAAVIGGGPIGILVAMIARNKGADVIVSDINPYRTGFAEKSGFKTINPLEEDIVRRINNETDGRGADVVFEVSASENGAAVMTEIASIRARLVCVGIFFRPVKIDLNKFFIRELELYGARVYEKEDFDEAIKLAAYSDIPFSDIITARYKLEDIEKAFSDREKTQDGMKTIIKIREDGGKDNGHK